MRDQWRNSLISVVLILAGTYYINEDMRALFSGPQLFKTVSFILVALLATQLLIMAIRRITMGRWIFNREEREANEKHSEEMMNRLPDFMQDIKKIASKAVLYAFLFLAVFIFLLYWYAKYKGLID